MKGFNRVKLGTVSRSLSRLEMSRRFAIRFYCYGISFRKWQIMTHASFWQRQQHCQLATKLSKCTQHEHVKASSTFVLDNMTRNFMNHKENAYKIISMFLLAKYGSFEQSRGTAVKCWLQFFPHVSQSTSFKMNYTVCRNCKPEKCKDSGAFLCNVK